MNQRDIAKLLTDIPTYLRRISKYNRSLDLRHKILIIKSVLSVKPLILFIIFVAGSLINDKNG